MQRSLRSSLFPYTTLFRSASIILPSDYVGPIMELCQEKRGVYKTMEYPTTGRVVLVYELPLAEILMDFYDKLKSRSRRSEEHTSELQSRPHLVCRLLLEKK